MAGIQLLFRRHRTWLAALAAAAALAACAAPGDMAPQGQPKAVFIIVDGIPADVVERVQTPAIDAISADGGYTRAYVGGEVGGVSESPTISAVGYMSLITGTWANKHNVWDNDVADPDYRYWDIFRIARAANPGLHTALFSTWTDNRTRLLGDGLPAAGGNKLTYWFDGLDLDTVRYPPDEAGDYIREIDQRVVADAARYIRQTGPALSWVYLQYTDDVAHLYGDSPEFDAAVRLMDSEIGMIRNAVLERRADAGEDWLIVVTTDHGRDADTGMEHGGQTERERTTWIATDSRRLNGHFRQHPAVVDILPSILRHMDLAIPAPVAAELDGQSFID